VRERFGAPERFFELFLVVNYCPLVFIEDSGRNRTPDKLPAAEQKPLFAACDRALRATAELLEPRYVIGVGAFAEKRIRAALGDRDVRVGRILHPSPASPLANRGWAEQAERQLEELGVEL
jgi:single-strand selective monofunctional uracil DNA glycosylase